MKTSRFLEFFNSIPIRPSAFLFDLDGVLLDSENQCQAFWTEMAIRTGKNPKEFPTVIKGLSTATIVEQYFDAEIRGDVCREYQDYLANLDYHFFEGALDLLDICRQQDIRVAIVTSSDENKMAKVIGQYPVLKSLVDVFLFDGLYVRPKPAPDCWLTASEKLSVAIDGCVVFEDSVNGLISARNSGAYVIGLGTTFPMSVIMPYCDRVYTCITELIS